MKLYCAHCKKEVDEKADHVYMLNIWRCRHCGKLSRRKVSLWYIPIFLAAIIVGYYINFRWLDILIAIFAGIAGACVFAKSPLVPYRGMFLKETEDAEKKD